MSVFQWRNLYPKTLLPYVCCFFLGGKITQSTSEGITLIDANGTRLIARNVNDCNDLPALFELMWKHAQEARNHCLMLENMLSQLQGENFPVIVGRRPIMLPSNEKENQIPTLKVSSIIL